MPFVEGKHRQTRLPLGDVCRGGPALAQVNLADFRRPVRDAVPVEPGRAAALQLVEGEQTMLGPKRQPPPTGWPRGRFAWRETRGLL